MMTYPTFRATFALAALVAIAGADRAQAQLVYPQPTVAYSPVVPAQAIVAPQPVVPQQVVVARPVMATQAVVVPQPVVLQQAPRARRGWYPGKYIGQMFSRRSAAPQPVVAAPVVAPQPMVAQPTFVTAAYRPTFPPSYTTYSASYAPMPMVQTVARPVALAPACTTCAMPVTMSPCDTCSTCSSPCDSCGSGVVTAGFEAPANPGCSGCAGGGQSSYPQSYSAPAPQQSYGPLEPTPAIPPGANVPESRVNRPELPTYETPVAGPELSPNDAPGGDTSWWDPPQLFDNRDRSAARPTTRQPTANVWNAVYQQPTGSRPSAVQQTAYRPATRQPAPRNQQVGAGGWRSAE